MRQDIAAAILLAALAAGSAAAQTPAGGEFRVNEQTAGSQYYPGVAADAAGNFIVVWAGNAGGKAPLDIFARRFDASGTPLGAEFQVNTYTTESQLFPAVTADAAGNFVVVWESFGQDGDIHGIFGRRFDAEGNPTTGEFAVNTYTTSAQYEPAVAMDGAGGFVVVWQSYLQDGTLSTIFGQRFDADGNRLGGEFQVNSYTNGAEYRPAVAASADGGFVVAWDTVDQEGVGSGRGVFARRFDSAGQPLAGDFLVNTFTTGNQDQPSLAAERSGAFTVTWSTNSDDIAGQRYNADGTRRGGEFPVNTFHTDVQSFSSVKLDANANIVAAWESMGQDGSGRSIVARRFDCDGQPLGPDFVVNTYTTGTQRRPVVEAAAGDFVVVWTSLGQDGDGGGIYAQRYRGQPACGRFYAVPPCRLVDTRDPPATPLAANTTRTFQMSGSCAIPTSAKAVVLNVTAVAPTDLGNLRLYPAGEAAPLASALNFVPGQTRANSAMVRLGASGRIDVQCDMPPGSTGRTHLVVDTTGYFR
jgi:hypothetical protein